MIEVARAGSTDPAGVERAKVGRILTEVPALQQKLAASASVNDLGQTIWNVEIDRVKRVITKLAQGHIAYELCLPKLERPASVEMAPIHLLTSEEFERFEASGPVGIWPELGSMAFIRASKGESTSWITVQPQRYRYFVTEEGGDTVRIVLSEYLACQVMWD